MTTPVPQSVSRPWLVSVTLALVAATFLIYAPVARHGFIPFDDPQYVVDNPHVNSGLTWDNARWAFTSGEQGNWHPLTWISHMLDVEIFGLDAGRHHLTNVGLHALNGVLLLLLLVRVTGARWPSATVAALFVVHPLHVESVAWIAERKDVLSTLFWSGALLAYVAYARRRSTTRYLLVMALFAAGLMAKPMVVTLPFVLLLLDLWPLRRIAPGHRAAWWPLIREKLPLVAMTIASSVITFIVQQQGGAVRTLEALPIARRLETAVMGYQTYLVRLFWPADLSVLYPFPETVPLWQVAGAALLLVAMTLFSLRAVRTRPWITIGWLWFIGTLVPVIGIVQVGSQPVADRYTYIPYTGIFIALAWTVAEWLRARPSRQRLAAPAAIVVLAWLGVIARGQVNYWRDGVTLWTRALEVTDRNYRAHSALGVALEAQGRDDAAVDQYVAALAIRPTYPEALNNLAGIRSDRGELDAAAALLSSALAVAPDHVESIANLAVVRTREGRLTDAIRLFERARSLQSDSAAVRNGLAFALSLAGRHAEARRELEEAVRLTPNDPEVYANLGLILGDERQLEDAMRAFRQALSLAPDHARSRYGLGSVLHDAGRPDEALVELDAAIRQDRSMAEAHHERGRVLVTLGRLPDAVAALATAVSLRPTDTTFHYDLAAVLLKTNQRDQAIGHLEEVLRLDPGHAGARAALRALGRLP